MRNLLLILSVAFLSACGGGGKSGGAQDKNLFSSWSGSTVLDLSASGFGTSDIYFMFTENQGCACDVNITGTQSSGTASVYNCIQLNTSYACTNFQDSYTYNKSQTVLTLCDAGNNCEVYQ